MLVLLAVAGCAPYPGVDELVIEGRNLDGPRRFSETFSVVSYEGREGAPSYASSSSCGS